jgi:hypothetical protein
MVLSAKGIENNNTTGEVMEKILESHIRKRVIEEARKKGWLHRKWSSPGHRGVPDDLFFKKKIVIMIEFKRPGEVPRAQQRKTHTSLKKEGFRVHVIDNIEKGKKLFN